jgi:hypothetical protein
MKFWMNTISKSHVDRGVAGGFTQAGHGQAAPLRRLAQGDAIVFYSPRSDYPEGQPVQAFTAIGTITDEAPYQAGSDDDAPWRRHVDFAPCETTPIAPLIESLDFIRNKRSWGVVFRRGLFEIGEADFERIAAAMKAPVLAAVV